MLPARHGDVQPARDRAPGFGQALLDRVGDDDLAGLGLARHPVRGMHRGSEDIARLDDDRPEVAADADRDLLAFDLEVRDGAAIAVCITTAASIAASQSSKVAMTSSPMVFTTDPPCCSVARRMISMQTATLSRAATSPRISNKPSTADDVGEENGELLVLAHGPSAPPRRMT